MNLDHFYVFALPLTIILAVIFTVIRALASLANIEEKEQSLKKTAKVFAYLTVGLMATTFLVTMGAAIAR